MVEVLLKNWKTTITGVLAIIAAVTGAATALMNNHPVDWPSVIGAVTAGIGLITAKDSNVTGGTIPQAGGTIPASPAGRADAK